MLPIRQVEAARGTNGVGVARHLLCAVMSAGILLPVLSVKCAMPLTMNSGAKLELRNRVFVVAPQRGLRTGFQR